MRIIGGRYKRRRLKQPPSSSTRPTRDRVKETLFNMLGPIPKGRVLDAFAGSGALGIEALSRGAKAADFIEADPEAFNVLEQNLETLGLISDTQLYEVEAETMFETLEGPYDLIFLDPPYGEGRVEASLEAIVRRMLLASDGRIVALHYSLEDPLPKGDLRIYKERTIGVTGVTIYEWSG